MKRTIATVGALGAGLTLALTSAAPAHAADATITLRNTSGVVIARATWNDAYDRLCVRSFVKGRTMTAHLELLYQDWGPVSISHSGWSTTPNCTGNLSIPEDRKAFVWLGDEQRSTDGTFYT